MVWNDTAAIAARYIILSVTAASFVLFGTATAQSTNDITLRLNSTSAEAGDTVELGLSLVINGDAPESIIAFLAYDPQALAPNSDEYELVLRHSVTGDPILDDDGNVMTVRRAVLPDDSLDDAGKTVDSQEFMAEGVLGVSITGLNMTALSNGALVTIAFTVASGLSNGTMTDVIGLTENNAIVIPDGSGGVVAAASSASRSTAEGSAVAVSYDFENAEVFVGCEPPLAPTGVTATQDRSDGVLVGWSAVATTGAEYRVYRNTTNNAATSLPLGESWQSNTTFLDITARVPEVVAGDGCTVADQINEVHYFYWVRARTPEGCQGLLSAASAEGFRTQAKSLATAAGILPVTAALDKLFLYGLLLSCFAIGYRGRSRVVAEG